MARLPKMAMDLVRTEKKSRIIKRAKTMGLSTGGTKEDIAIRISDATFERLQARNNISE